MAHPNSIGENHIENIPDGQKTEEIAELNILRLKNPTVLA